MRSPALELKQKKRNRTFYKFQFLTASVKTFCPISSAIHFILPYLKIENSNLIFLNKASNFNNLVPASWIPYSLENNTTWNIMRENCHKIRIITT